MSDTNTISIHLNGSDNVTRFDTAGLYALNIGAAINDGLVFLVKKKINDFYGNGSAWDNDLINTDEIDWLVQLSLNEILGFSRDYNGQTINIHRNVFDQNGETHVIHAIIKHD